MNILLTIITTACMLLPACGPVFAIEKTRKDLPKTEIKSRVSDTGSPAKTTPGATGNSDTKQTTSGKSFNDFIDSNNNGIDDRSERKVSGKTKKPKAVTPEPKKKETP